MKMNDLRNGFSELETDEIIRRFRAGLTKEAAEVALKELLARGFNDEQLAKLKSDAEEIETSYHIQKKPKHSKFVQAIGWFFLAVLITSTIKLVAKHLH